MLHLCRFVPFKIIKVFMSLNKLNLEILSKTEI